MIKESFTLRVLVVSFLLLALPLLIDSFIFFQNSYYETVHDAKEELKQVVNLKTFTLIAAQPVKMILLNELAYLLHITNSVLNTNEMELSQDLSQIVHVGGEFQLFILVYEKGGHFKIVASSDTTLVNAYFTSYRELESVLEKGSGTFIRHLYSAREEGYVPYIFIAKAIDLKDSQHPKGILMARANITTQLHEVLERSMETKNLKFAVLNPDGIVFAANDPRLEGELFDPLTQQRREEIIASGQMGADQLAKKALPIIKGDAPPFFEFVYDDKIQIAYRAYIPEVEISLVGYAPKEEFFKSALLHFLFLYTSYGLILIIGGGVTYGLALWISRPLRQLSRVMGEVKQGNLQVRFQQEPLGFEINLLGSIFNQTIDNLLENIQRTEDERVRKETYQRELAIGRRVQRDLLPSHTPELKGATIAGTYLPSSDVGGDFYGFLSKTTKQGEEALIFAIVDVVGSGISSCLYSLTARSFFRTFATLTDDIGEVLALANKEFIQATGGSGAYVTVFMGMFHVKSHRLEYYSCGHIPGIYMRTTGEMTSLKSAGLALGLQGSGDYRAEALQLEGGDLIFLYTDSLVGAINENEQTFSEELIKAILHKREWSCAQEVLDAVVTEFKAFTHATPPKEEIIIVALYKSASNQDEIRSYRI